MAGRSERDLVVICMDFGKRCHLLRSLQILFSSRQVWRPARKGITQHAVRLALAEEDAAELAQDEVVAIHDDISSAMLIASVIDLETQQARLKFDSNKLDGSATMLQLAKIQERKNSLQRRINAWTAMQRRIDASTAIQHLYLPTVSVLRARDDRDASDATAERLPQDLPLYLPSSLPGLASCSLKLRQHEFRLREARK